MAHFTHYNDRNAVVRRGTHLKGTNIYLNEVMSSAFLAINYAQMPLFNQARGEGKIAFFSHSKLIARERTSGSAVGLGKRSMRAEGAAGGALSWLVPLNVTASVDDATDAGAAGVDGAVGGVGATGSDGGVVPVEAAGAWTAVDNICPRLFSSPAAPFPRHKEGKKVVRSGTRM